jgi:opacity protein-like surface antigen
MMKRACLIVASLLALTLPAIAGEQPVTLKGSSTIELNFGIWNELKAGQFMISTGMEQTAKANGFLGGLTYCYWTREYLAVSLTGSLLSTKASSTIYWAQLGVRMPSRTYQNTTTAIAILAGVRYFIPRSEPGDHIRSYLSIAVGSFMGFESNNTPLVQSAHSKASFGGRVGAGVDFFIGSKVKVDASFGFNAMTDFQNTIGARKNFNGGDGSIGIGYQFGG